MAGSVYPTSLSVADLPKKLIDFCPLGDQAYHMLARFVSDLPAGQHERCYEIYPITERIYAD